MFCRRPDEYWCCSRCYSQLAVIQDDESLKSLDAVKNGRVYPIMLSEMYASATRTQDGIETFAKGLYPDVNLD